MALVSITFSLIPDGMALELTLQSLVFENIPILFMLYWSLSYSLIILRCYDIIMSLHYDFMVSLHYDMIMLHYDIITYDIVTILYDIILLRCHYLTL